MNVLGLFLASSLRRNLVARGRPCTLRGGMRIDADGMRATVRFDDTGATITRKEEPVRVELRGGLPLLVRALTQPRIGTMLKVKVKGSRLFALRAMRLLAP